MERGDRGFTPQFTCRDCPARFLERGEFDVVDADDSFDFPTGENGYRLNAQGVPTCIHPHKIGLEEQTGAAAVVAVHTVEVTTMAAARPEVPVITIERDDIPTDREDFFEWVARLLFSAESAQWPALFEAIEQAAATHYTQREIIDTLEMALQFVRTADDD